MALRLACKRFVTTQQPRFASVGNQALRTFAAAAPAEVIDPSKPPTVFDKIISLTIVDPSGARRKINCMIGECELILQGFDNMLCIGRTQLDAHLKFVCISFYFNTWSGTSLYDACESNEVELGPSTIGGPPIDVHSERWTEPVFGEGPTSGYDHVVLSGPGADTAGPVTRAESRMLEDYWDFDEVFPESRLASQIKLTKQMDGMIVYVPPRVDDSNP